MVVVVTGGVIAGAAIAWAASRVMTGLVYGVTIHDAGVFAAAPLVLVLAALAATIVPARRAMRSSRWRSCGRTRIHWRSGGTGRIVSALRPLAHLTIVSLTIARYAALAGCLLTLAPREARAWSRDGHRIVCRIAWQLLDSARRSEIDRLTSSYRDQDGQAITSYWDACSFADEARAKARGSPAWSRFSVFETWHYANVPRTTTRLPSPPCQAMCVILAIPAHADSLRLATSDASRTEALFFLSHWVGDMHQPLHLGFADDRGGNDVRPVEGGYYSVSSMHALWDGAMPGKLLGSTSWMDFADQLARDVTPAQQASWIQGTATDWAQESYNLITSPKAQYCVWEPVGDTKSCSPRPGGRTFSEQYQLEFGDDVALRWQQAGVRLAELIRANLPLR